MTHDDTPDALDIQPAAAAKPVADDIWIVDDWLSPVGKLKVPIRMTVIRLSSGDLLLAVADRCRCYG